MYKHNQKFFEVSSKFQRNLHGFFFPLTADPVFALTQNYNEIEISHLSHNISMLDNYFAFARHPNV